MEEIKLIKQIKLIIDGVKYSGDDILKDKYLFNIIIQNRHNLPNSIINEIISENGTIKITTSKTKDIFIVSLEGVSPQLYDQFLQINN